MEQPLTAGTETGNVLQTIYRLFDEVPFAVASLKGPSLIIEYVNQYTLNIWQREKEEVLGRPLFDILPETRVSAEPVHQEVYRTGKRYQAREIPVEVSVNGKLQTRYFNSIVDPMFNEQGEIIGQLATTIEVTEQVLARRKAESSEAELSSLADAMPQVVWMARPDGEVIYYNNRVAQFAGAQKLPDGAWRWEGMLHEEDLQPTVDAWNRAIKEVSIYQKEHRIRMHDGTYRWHLSRAFPQKDENGKILKWYGTATDIHDVTTASEKIKESEEQLRFAVDAADLGTWDYNPLTNKFTANSRLKEWFGLKPENEIDLSLAIAVIAENDRQRVSDAIQEALQYGSGGRYDIEYTITNPLTGQERIVRAKGRASFTDEKTAYRFDGTLQDVTMQAKARRRIEESEEQLKTALEGGDLGAYDFYPQTGALYWSAKTKELFGLPPEADVDYSIYLKGLHPDDKERSDAAVQKAMHPENSGHYENEYRTIGITDGKQRWVRSKGKIHFDTEGKAIRFSGITQDITKYKQAEEVLAYRKALLEAQNEAIPDAVLIVDTKGAMISYNKQFAVLWNIPQEIIDRKDDAAALQFAMTQVADPQAFIEQVNYCYVHPQIKDRAEVLFKDGRIIERFGNAVIGEDEVKYGWIWYFRDITAQKKLLSDLNQKIKEISDYQYALDESSIVAITDQKGIINYVNDNFCKISKYSAEELVGQDHRIINSGFHSKEYIRNLWVTIAHGKIWKGDLKNRAKDGSYYWVDTTIVPFLNEEGKPYQYVAIRSDISARKRAEEALAYQKQLLETVTDNTSLALFLMNERQHCIYMNDAAEEMTGFRLHEVQGRQLHYFVHHTHPDGTPFPLEECPIDQALPTHKRMKGEEVFVHKDGSFYPVAFTASPIIVDGQGVGTVIEVRDTTEEKRKQQELKESVERFRTLAETLPQMIWVTDENGQNEYYSHQWLEYAGIENPYEAWDYMVHPDEKESSKAAYEKAYVTRQAFKTEVRLKNKEGEYRWHSSVAVPVSDASGKVLKWIGALTDIHDQKTITERLEKIVAERTKELQRSNEDLQQFAHVASHDLKEPVRKIMTFSNRLKDEIGVHLSERVNTYLSKIESSAIRMYSMIDGVLLYSSLNALEQTKELVHLNELMQSVEADLEVPIAEKGAQITYSGLPSIEGSTILLYQLFYNLINNSLKFSKAGVPPAIVLKSILLSEGDLKAYNLDKEKRYAAIHLQDNGIGFNNREAEKIFSSFTRLHSKDKYEGTGLGLALCKKIVERHGGIIRAEGKEGEGAAFIIVLPE